MADFGGSDLAAFRAEAREWIAANFPAALKGKPTPEGRELSPEQDAWRKAMGDKGWGVPTWPTQYGGGGLGRAEARVIQEELVAAGAYNPIGGMCRCFCASLPYSSSVGPNIITPMPPIGL